jgi:hypothetical protein
MVATAGILRQSIFAEVGSFLTPEGAWTIFKDVSWIEAEEEKSCSQVAMVSAEDSVMIALKPSFSNQAMEA